MSKEGFMQLSIDGCWILGSFWPAIVALKHVRDTKSSFQAQFLPGISRFQEQKLGRIWDYHAVRRHYMNILQYQSTKWW